MTILLALLLASPPSGATPYDIQPAPHAAASVALFGVVGMYTLLVQGELRGGQTCEAAVGTESCDPSKINDLDRTVVGNRSDAWLLASDITAGAAVLAVAGGTLVDALGADTPTPVRDAVTDAAVIAETTAVATFVTYLLKQAVRRPRPTQYSERFDSRTTIEHQFSFPSGHTASTSALVTAYATTYALRHPHAPSRFLVGAAAASVILVTGWGRIAGGFHFYTDVLAGALIGVSAGWALPTLLARDDLAITPVVGKDGGGAALTLFW